MRRPTVDQMVEAYSGYLPREFSPEREFALVSLGDGFKAIRAVEAYLVTLDFLEIEPGLAESLRSAIPDAWARLEAQLPGDSAI